MAEPQAQNPQPEKFVRTFASDAAALKSGQAPDFEKKPASPKAMPVSPLPAPAAPERTGALDLDSLPETRIEALAPAAPPPPPPEVTPLHTYKSDFADEVKEKNASQADIIAAEEDARPVRAAPVTAGIDWLIVLSLVLIIIGIAAAGGAYYWRAQHPETVATAPVVSAPIFVDEQQEISGSGTTLMAAIAASVANPLAANAIRLLYTTDSSATTSVWNALDLPAPELLLRNITPAGSMAGIVNANGTASPFFILAVTSYSDTFSGMLAFEPTMQQALATIYPAYSTSSAATSSTQTATSTPVTAAPAAFRDQTIENHDVRELVDSSGNIILLYGYFDQQTLIIARDGNAFAAVLDRLTNSRTTS